MSTTEGGLGGGSAGGEVQSVGPNGGEGEPRFQRASYRVSSLVSLVDLRTTVWILLATITILALALRLYKLGEWSFWRDEMFTVSGREDGFNYNLLRQSLSLSLIQLFVERWGVNEWNARILPALIGTLSIPLLYPLLQRILRPVAAVLAVLLLTLSPWHIYWSQNARFYTLLLLFYSVALLTFHVGLEKDQPRWFLVSLLFLGLAARERLLALFFIPVVIIYLAVLVLGRVPRPKGLRWRNLAIFLIPGLFVGAIFVRPYLLNFSGWMEGFGYSNNSPVWLVAGTLYYVGLPVVALAGAAILYGFIKKERVLLLLGAGAVVPLILLATITPFHYTANRYLFMTLTSWVSLAAFAAVEIVSRLRGESRLLGVGLIGLLAVQPLADDFLYYRSQSGNRDDWKGAYAVVEEQLRSGDQVFSSDRTLADFYLGRNTKGLGYFDGEEILAGNKRVWIVEDMMVPEKYPEVHEWVQKNARLVAVRDVVFQARTFTMRVYLFEPD